MMNSNNNIFNATMENCFDSIMKLAGADEFKDTIKRLHIFLKNKEAYSLDDITLPNYLLIAKRGGGVTTLLNAFAEYLYAARAIEFCGTVKFFEFELGYVHPDAIFSELTRLDNTISSFAGHNRFFKGMICVNIEEWIEHTGDDHFIKLLNYISSNNDRLMIIFCIHNDSRNIVEAVESALSSHIRLESISLRFPGSNELVEFVESRYLKGKGLSFEKNAKEKLRETIEEIAAEKQFNGFKSILRLADDIMYSVFTADTKIKKTISADMLSGYGKNSNYVKRAKAQKNAKKTIGFVERG